MHKISTGILLKFKRMDMLKSIKKSITWGHEKLTLETGKIADKLIHQLLPLMAKL